MVEGYSDLEENVVFISRTYILNVYAAGSSETLVTVYQTARRYTQKKAVSVTTAVKAKKVKSLCLIN
jgi:hypothetical protein